MDFLLVINTDLHHISHRFQVIANYWSNLRFLAFVHSFGWISKLRTTKFGFKKLETSTYHMMLIYLQTIISFCLTFDRRLTSFDAFDRRTDRQTDRLAMARARHSIYCSQMRAKNWRKVSLSRAFNLQ